MLKALTLIFSLVLTSSAFADTLFDEGRGAWVGTGIQGGETWEVNLIIVPGGAQVDYPDIPCGGVWTFPGRRTILTEWPRTCLPSADTMMPMI